jgi:hypothetical protein
MNEVDGLIRDHFSDYDSVFAANFWWKKIVKIVKFRILQDTPAGQLNLSPKLNSLNS